MLFSPWCYGHHPSYVRHLIHYWCLSQLSGTLNIVVSPEFMLQHDDVVALAKDCDRQNINFVSMTDSEQANLESRTSGFSRAFEQYQLIVRYAKKLKATQGLIMYFDSCQLPFVLGLKLPCPFSGIYFRPTFHYTGFAQYTPSWKERLQHWRERIFLARLLHHPQLKSLFCLDPFAVNRINQLHKRASAVYLPDPVQVENDAEPDSKGLRERLGIEPSRRVFFLFGRLADPRKGAIQLIEAVSVLPPHLCQKLCLLFVGEPDRTGKEQLESWLAPVRQSLPIQIITHYGYVPESEVQPYFQLSDVVLAPYQKHVGMSGILLLAAAAEKPVLSSNYGLMGEMVRHYGLGLAVDTTAHTEIAQGLTRFLLESPDDLCDRAKMKSFAQENSAERFAKAIFKRE